MTCAASDWANNRMQATQGGPYFRAGAESCAAALRAFYEKAQVVKGRRGGPGAVGGSPGLGYGVSISA
jgi:hypothetical protein